MIINNYDVKDESGKIINLGKVALWAHMMVEPQCLCTKGPIYRSQSLSCRL